MSGPQDNDDRNGQTATDLVLTVERLLRENRIGEALAVLSTLEGKAGDGPLVEQVASLYLAAKHPQIALRFLQSKVVSPDTPHDRLVFAAHTALQADAMPAAIAFLERACATAAASAASWHFLASLQLRSGRLHDAERSSGEAMRLEPDNAAHRRLLAAILSRLDRAGDVVAILEAEARRTPDDHVLHRELSAALSLAGRLPEALAAARKAVSLDPRNVDYRLHLSGLLTAVGKLPEAIAELRSAIEHDPRYALAHYSLAHLLWRAGERDMAIHHATQATQLDEAGHFKNFLFSLLQQSADQAMAAPGAGAGSADPSVPRQRRHQVSPLVERGRVIFALMLREMQTRHASTRLGFAWAIVEPVTHLAVLAVVFSIFNRGRPPIGTDWFFFYATGVVPFLMWSHVTTNGFHGLVSNLFILQIPAIRRLDVLFANALVELAISFVVGGLLFGAFAILGTGALPQDPLAVLQGMALIWVFALGLSIINATVETVNGTWLRIWPSIVRLQYFTSGIFYVPQEMPPWLREILALNPVLQGIEWIRSGFFDQYDPPWLDKEYAVVAALATLLFGMALEVALRRRAIRI